MDRIIAFIGAYISKLFKWWWVLVADVATLIVLIILPIGLSDWAWVTLGFAGLVIAQGIAAYEFWKGGPGRAAVLQLGDPIRFLNQMIDGSYQTLWRIPLTNTARNNLAEDVSVRLASTAPNFSWLPVDLHRMHDNNWPYERRHSVRYDEPLTFDLMSRENSDSDDALYYSFRSDGNLQNVFDYMMSQTECALIDVASRHNEGFALTVRAIANQPAESAEEVYQLRRVDGAFQLTRRVRQ